MGKVSEGRVQILDVDGSEVIVISLSGLDRRGMLDTLGEAARVIRSQAPGSGRVLTDLTGARFTLATTDGEYDRMLVEGVRSLTLRNEPYIHATAVVLRRDDADREFMEYLEQISGRHFELFDTRLAALRWIVRQ